ncbi:uncharacterized protein YjdB [Anaerotaenia torta]|uniref:Ig-like domain-containing protein n=1 Tax=Anaerotaenia torta TaxID=433293 RepID=UPI003D24A9AE
MLHLKKFLLSILICTALLPVSALHPPVHAKANSIQFVILSKYKATMSIGDELQLIAITTNGTMPAWKSSSSAIASVNTYGKITAKKAGTATITAKIKGGEASCHVTVQKTTITISEASVSLERNAVHQLTAKSSTKTPITWKSSKKSVAIIDENGKITGIKPGETLITASADKSSQTCLVKVKLPTVKLSQTKVKLFRGQTSRLTASVSSGVAPKWKTNRKSVAVVDESGTITAIKHGTATITATVDGISHSCEVTVASPAIELSKSELNLKVNAAASLSARVSSGNPVTWSSSNENVVTVDQNGQITAWKKGRAYVYASEDGTKVRCTVYVTDNQ